MRILYLDTVDSTNEYVKDLSGKWVAAVADTQTDGRGTKGRKFHSPLGGLYMSIAFDSDASKIKLVTHLAAVAVRRAIQIVLNIKCDIKWVNDLIYRGKKVCGISASSVTVGDEIRAVVGIGVNVFRPKKGYGEYGKVAGNLCDGEYDKAVIKKLAECIAKYFRVFYEKAPYGMFMEDYSANLAMYRQNIRFKRGSETIEGILYGVDKEGRLLIKTDTEIKKFRNGEIIYDYK